MSFKSFKGLSNQAIMRIAQQMEEAPDNVSYLPQQSSGGGTSGDINAEVQELKDWVDYLVTQIDSISMNEVNQSIQLLNDWVNSLIDRMETVEQEVTTFGESMSQQPAVQQPGVQQTQQQVDPTQSWQKFKDTFNPTKWNWDF